jgi:hypothetical protein
MDEITPLMFCFIIFLPARNLVVGLILGIILMKIYKKMKDRLPQYFYFHYLWYFGVWNPKMKKTLSPQGHITVYRE